MKKRLFLIISLCMMLVLGLSACGEDPRKADYNGHTYEELMDVSQNTANALMSMSDEELQGYLMQGADEVTTHLVSRWLELRPSVGAYVEFGEFSIAKTGKTLTTTQTIDFEKRDVTLTVVYNYFDMSMEDITLDEIYTTGEKMQKAAMNTLMGLGSVFLILILISLIIYCFKLIPALQEAFENRGKATEQAPAPVVEQAAPIVEPEAPVQQKTDDLELVAVIAAAIAAATGTTTDSFVVRSIKRR